MGLNTPICPTPYYCDHCYIYFYWCLYDYCFIWVWTIICGWDTPTASGCNYVWEHEGTGGFELAAQTTQSAFQ